MRRVRGGGEILEPHESLDDSQLDIAVYVDDGSGHFQILAAEHGAVDLLQPSELFQARLDTLRELGDIDDEIRPLRMLPDSHVRRFHRLIVSKSG